MRILTTHPPEGLGSRHRWWTVEAVGKRWDCVRVDVSHVAPDTYPLFLFIPVGLHNSPPMLGLSFELDPREGFAKVDALGGRIIHQPTEAGRRLELVLMARRL